MGANSKIEWTDTTWNPVVGCRAYSSGCAHCYAETMSNRLAAMAAADTKAGKGAGRKSHYLNVINEKGKWRGNVELVPEALNDPFSWKRPRRVFVNSMSDLFYGDDADRRACESKGVRFDPVPTSYIQSVLRVIGKCPQHTFQVLTKRTARMAEEMTRWVNGCGHPIMHNLWLGTSVENPDAAYRIDILRTVPAAVRFLSMEPLLRPVQPNLEGIHWVIVGGESGPGARPLHPDWVRSIRDQCQTAGVPFFFKQWGEWLSIGGMNDGESDRFYVSNKKAPEGEEWKQSELDECYGSRCIVETKMVGFDGVARAPGDAYAFYAIDGHGAYQAFRVGKKAAGRLLDGREWNEMPRESH